MKNGGTAVVDANIWIDLHNGGILPHAFRLRLHFVTPDVIAQEALRNPSFSTLQQLGIEVVELPSEQVADVLRLASSYPAPSRTDLFPLALARARRALLLTGDRHLREAAEEEHVRTHGVLWLVDRMAQAGVLSGPEAADAVRAMQKSGSRLPKGGCEAMIRKWSGPA